MELNDRIAGLGASILRYLISGIDKHSYWGLVVDNPDHESKISRGASQLIESLSWLDCQEETFQKVRLAADFLREQSSADPARVAVSASRLKSLMQYCECSYSEFFELPAVVNSLTALVEMEVWQPGRDIHDQLCVADLFGYFCSLNPDSRYRQALAAVPLSEKVQQSYGLLLNAIEAWSGNREAAHGSPKELSFALWLLFVGERFGRRPEAVEGEILGARLQALRHSVDEYDQKHRRGKPYRSEYFPGIVYPKLFLAWRNRKLRSPEERAELFDFFEWIIPVGERLLETKGDAYHLGLVLKVCIAAQKERVRQRFRQAALDFAIQHESEQRDREVAKERALVAAVIRDRLRVTITSNDRLTGGWSAAQVWRVAGRYQLPLDNQIGEGAVGGNDFAFVVKTGPRDRFVQAAGLYSALPKEGRDLFPRHDPDPSVVATSAGPTFYLIMQELRDHEAVGRNIFRLATKDPTAALPSAKIGRNVDLALDVIERLHAVELAQALPGGEPRPAQVKVAEMFALVDRLQGKSGALRLLCSRRAIFEGPHTEERISLRPVRDMLVRALNGIGRIVPRTPVQKRHSLTHGDCHAYNIMIPGKAGGATRFVDIDGLAVDDYLQDYAELVAHLCFSIDLEDISEEEVSLEVHEDRSSAVGRLCTSRETNVWEAQRQIYSRCLDRVRKVALSRGDVGAELRLHLLISNRLLFVASKAKEATKAAIIFLRASACLDAVCASLSGGVGASAVPFSTISIVGLGRSRGG